MSTNPIKSIKALFQNVKLCHKDGKYISSRRKIQGLHGKLRAWKIKGMKN